MATLGIAEDSDDFADQICPRRGASCSGRATGDSRFPTTSPRAFREAVELARDRAHLPHLHR